jgi:hypothetical protein
MNDSEPQSTSMDASEDKPTPRPAETTRDEVARLQMPDFPEPHESAAWISAVRRFHLTGVIDRSHRRGSEDFPLTPAALTSRRWIEGRVAEQQESTAPWEQLLAAAAAGWRGQLGRASRGFTREIELLQSSNTAGEQVLIMAAASTYYQEVHARKERFVVEIETLIRGLQTVLGADGADVSGPLESALGEAATAHIDAEALSRLLSATAGPVDLSPDRRQRLEQLRTSLQSYLNGASEEPEVVVFCRQTAEESLPGLPIQIQRHDRPVEAAAECFDRVAAQMIEVIHAVRVAKLQLTRHANPDQAEEPPPPANWKRLQAAELGLLPQVVSMESSERLLGAELSSFSALMRSGRPVKVIAIEDLDCSNQSGDLLENKLAMGYLALAHREAFVLQESLARPHHLLQGLRQMAATSRPSAALVATSQILGRESQSLLEAAHAGRETISLTYDPDVGVGWSERLELTSNPDPESDWPAFEIEFLDFRGEPRRQTETFTFAHAAAMNPAYKSHFWVLPRSGWSAEQLEISLYLDAARERQIGSIPFLWVLTKEKTLARAVVTQEMTFACKDRRGSWNQLQQLAAPERSGAQPEQQVETSARLIAAEEEIRQLKATHAEELERMRQQAKRQAAERLVRGLLSGPTRTAS